MIINIGSASHDIVQVPMASVAAGTNGRGTGRDGRRGRESMATRKADANPLV